MNLADYRQRIARVVGLSSSDSGDLDLIDDWVNEGVVQFLREVKPNQITAALAVTAGSGDYTLDSDILSLTDAWYAPADANQDYVLQRVDSLEIQRMRRQTAAAEGSGPRYYSLQGAHLIQFHPTPGSNSDRLHILYQPRPAAMSTTAHAPSDATRGNVPEEYHPVIEAYAKWKAAQAEEHRPSEYGQQFQAEWERGLSMARASMNRKGGVFRTAKKVGRRGTWPVTPGTDW